MSKQGNRTNPERHAHGEAEGKGNPDLDASAEAFEATPDAGFRQESPEDSPRGESDRRMEELLAEKDLKIAALEEEVSTLKDQYLRKLADYENFRKRLFREKEDAVQYANSNLLVDLVGVMDDFERAIRSSETSREFQSLHDGIAMIERNLNSLLDSKYGLTRYESINQPFDPNRHEAMMSEQGECDEPTVIDEYVKGYQLRGRVLRSAKVKVRMPAEDRADS